jgi:hypothetical protein
MLVLCASFDTCLHASFVPHLFGRPKRAQMLVLCASFDTRLHASFAPPLFGDPKRA